MQVRYLKYKNIYFVFSGILVAASIYAILSFGLKPGIDFTGGSILEVSYEGARPTVADARASLSEFGEVSVQPTDQNGLIIRMEEIDEATHQRVLKILGDGYKTQEQRFESIGPVIGKELKEKTNLVIFLALAAIVLYVALAFRRVQRPVSAWQYGFIVLILAILHDLLIPIGVFAVLGKYWGVQITIPVITALLAVLGYSVNDTVVVFDRIRENLMKRAGTTFEGLVEASMNQTMARCVNTAFTTLLALLAIYFFGGETLRYFSLALIVGIAAGTYSSFFLAGPILVSWMKWRHR
ncbi:MAG: protein translocase subunit SecF [Candidatus Nealsonbacteria bacterium]|nr:protein translocase subunit SecF [Candidatus Nealsonbacteria bacterium]